MVFVAFLGPGAVLLGGPGRPGGAEGLPGGGDRPGELLPGRVCQSRSLRRVPGVLRRDPELHHATAVIDVQHQIPERAHT